MLPIVAVVGVLFVTSTEAPAVQPPAETVQVK